jgi:hypothetical protein
MISFKEQMKTKSDLLKKDSQQKSNTRIRKSIRPICVHRRGAFEFSCGCEIGRRFLGTPR